MEQRIVFRHISHRTGRQTTCTLTPTEFLRRYLQHTPPPGFHRIRYYGFLAPGARATLARLRAVMLSDLAAREPTLAVLRAQRASLPPYT